MTINYSLIGNRIKAARKANVGGEVLAYIW